MHRTHLQARKSIYTHVSLRKRLYKRDSENNLANRWQLKVLIELSMKYCLYDLFGRATSMDRPFNFIAIQR